MLASGLPVMLPERSNTRTMSVGLEEISGAAANAKVTFNVPLQSMRSTLICLFELVIPIMCFLRVDSWRDNIIPPHRILCREMGMGY